MIVSRGFRMGGVRLAEAVVAQPLDVPDPDDCLSQLVGVEINLDSVELLWANPRNPRLQSIDKTEAHGFLLQVQEPPKREVEEVARPGSWIQDPILSKLIGKAEQ